MSKNVSDVEYLKILEEAYEEAWEVANSEDGWKEEHKGSFLSYRQRININFHGAYFTILTLICHNSNRNFLKCLLTLATCFVENTFK